MMFWTLGVSLLWALVCVLEESLAQTWMVVAVLLLVVPGLAWEVWRHRS